MTSSLTEEVILKALEPVVKLLLRKDASYGSAYSKSCPLTSLHPKVLLRVRIGDKIRRLTDGCQFDDEDTLTDLLGYLVLLRVSELDE